MCCQIEGRAKNSRKKSEVQIARSVNVSGSCKKMNSNTHSDHPYPLLLPLLEPPAGPATVYRQITSTWICFVCCAALLFSRPSVLSFPFFNHFYFSVNIGSWVVASTWSIMQLYLNQDLEHTWSPSYLHDFVSRNALSIDFHISMNLTTKNMEIETKAYSSNKIFTCYIHWYISN